MKPTGKFCQDTASQLQRTTSVSLTRADVWKTPNKLARRMQAEQENVSIVHLYQKGRAGLDFVMMCMDNIHCIIPYKIVIVNFDFMVTLYYETFI